MVKFLMTWIEITESRPKNEVKENLRFSFAARWQDSSFASGSWKLIAPDISSKSGFASQFLWLTMAVKSAQSA